MNPRRACRIDANHKELSDAASAFGWFVIDSHEFAQYKGGFPDAIWAKPGRVVLAEYKVGNEPLTKAEKEFQRDWPDVYVVIRTVDDVVRVTEAR